jgi:predicted RNA-binding Zn-ribbon protein involved in translation (DUF1610 family)
MPGEVARALCPKCGTIVTAPEEWRLAQCPKCGQIITRMESDSTYD